MRAPVSVAAIAFALANLYLLYLTGPLVSPGHQLVFHLPGSATVLFVPVLLNLLGLTAIVFVLLLAAAHHPRLQLLLYAVLVLPVPAVLIATVAGFAGRPANVWLLGGFISLASAVLAYTVARLSATVSFFRRILPALNTGLSLLSLAGLVILGQLLWNGWQARHLNPPFLATAIRPGVTASPSRVVWIILDELSYRQIFSDRQPDLKLPNFDRLASQSAVLTQTRAAAQYTRIAVPSLLTGLPLRNTNPTADGQHLLLHARSQPVQTFDPADTVFGDTQHRGLPTGIVGWYEPYCRILPGVLNRCFWTYSDDLPAGLYPDASVATNTLGPIRAVILRLMRLIQAAKTGVAVDDAGRIDVARHRDDFRALYKAGDSLLQEQGSGLILLHMPIPHPWGFYDRRTGTFPSHRTSYLDNLALADLYLGHVRSVMESDGSWDRTTLIVMGDHGWRTHDVWRPSGFWAEEEEKASHQGTLEDHPAMFVKLPGQQTPARIDAPFAADRTRALINSLETGTLHTPDDLKQWIGN